MKSRVLILSILALVSFSGYSFNRKPVTKTVNSSQFMMNNLADSAYIVKNYALAVKYYYQIKHELQQELSNPEQFKYAYSLYRNGEYELSKRNFQNHLIF